MSLARIMMKNKYIFFAVLISALNSCGLEEPMEHVQGDNEKTFQVEFIARPTNYVTTSVSTKAAGPANLSSVENAIHSAFFLMYDSKGSLIKYENLTSSIPADLNDLQALSQLITVEKGLQDVTVCYIANLPESYVRQIMTVTEKDLEDNSSLTTDLKKLQATVIDFVARPTTTQKFVIAKPSESNYVGVPIIDVNDNRSTADDSYCLPMFGFWQGDLNSATSIEVPVKRLFAKVRFTIKLELPSSAEASSIHLKSVSVNRCPIKVNLFPQDSESQWAAAGTKESQFLRTVQEVDYRAVPNADIQIQNGGSAEFYFYVPEFIVYPYEERLDDSGYEGRQQSKPYFIGDKMATNVAFTASIDHQGQEIEATYTVYLGENAVDNYTLKRNMFYDNQIKIIGFSDGMFEGDDRVTVSYDGIGVAFKRSTLLDSHFEVRPIRVRLSDELLEDNSSKSPDMQGGTITVEVLGPDSDEASDAPDWLRLERPHTGTNDPIYCLRGDKSKTYTKRRYFTTNLLDDERLTTSISYDPFAPDDENAEVQGDLVGNIPIWLYVDEYSAESTDHYGAEEFRSARVRVKYIPNDKEAMPITQDFNVQQRAIYPVQSTKSGSSDKVYGMEFFEEYLHDYDALKEEDWGDEGGIYYSDYDGIKWGLDGIKLSRNYQSIYFDDVEVNNTPFSTNPADAINYRIMRGLVAIKDVERAFNSALSSDAVMLGMMNTQIAHAAPFYDFYVEETTLENEELQYRNYDGYNMNVEIIHYLLGRPKDDLTKNILLNQVPLDVKDPLSVIAYCYNKNKRDNNGNVATIDGETITTKYMHWYAPAIDELTDLTYSAFTSSDYFDNVFNDKWLYWSCQPAYELNKAEMLYKMNVNAKEAYYEMKYMVVPVKKGTATITAESRADANGDFLTEHLQRARATRVQQVSDKVNNAESGIGDIYNNYKFTASGTMTNFGSDFADQIQKLLNPTDWVKEVVPVTNEEDIDYDSYPGNQLRNVNHRVRCVYNPNPPKSATRSTDDRGASSYQYTY